MTDDLDHLLAPSPSGGPDRAALLAATTRIVRRRYVFRRVLKVAAVGGVFLAGASAAWMLKPARVEREMVMVNVPPPGIEPPPAPQVEPPPSSPAPQAVALTTDELEQKAELSDDKAEVARLYREAGDRYAAARDYAQAARCYRLHLDAATEEVRQVTAADSWLLMTMKTTPR